MCEMNIRKLGKLKKSQIGWRGYLVTISDQLSYCQPTWMAAITRNQKNGCHGSTVKDKHL